MVYGQKPKYHNLLVLNKLEITVHAAKYPNVSRRSYGTLDEDKGSTTRFMSSYRLENKGGNPEYL